VAYYLYQTHPTEPGMVKRYEPLIDEMRTGPATEIDRYDHLSPVLSLPFKSTSRQGAQYATALAAARKRAIPIAPEDGLFLEPLGQGDDRRFAETFASVW
jgi:hypothetical protein